ncbi:DUF3604 domain-containing protein [Actinoplanes sp. CA-015351]|uniref:DUF3604 domain-containing protein n=1 Tax=Actinoplanes sp. CA-015351 TaxID=3239897 RepID=UPI003D96EDBC
MTDEHGTEWGCPEGEGRTGIWAAENTRNAVLAAMRARRFFATRVSGLRLDATAAGVRMRGTLPLTSGDVRFAVDLDRGPDWLGKPLKIQVRRPDRRRSGRRNTHYQADGAGGGTTVGRSLQVMTFGT